MPNKYRRFRDITGLTQEQFAEQSGIPLTTWRYAEYGRKPDIETLIKLSEFIGISIDNILKMN